MPGMRRVKNGFSPQLMFAMLCQNLRDNMTNVVKAIAKEGGNIAKDARLNIEKRTGKKVISSVNAKDKLQLDIKSED